MSQDTRFYGKNKGLIQETTFALINNVMRMTLNLHSNEAAPTGHCNHCIENAGSQQTAQVFIRLCPSSEDASNFL